MSLLTQSLADCFDRANAKVLRVTFTRDAFSPGAMQILVMEKDTTGSAQPAGFSTVFLLGFIADPIINLYVDPVETIVYKEFWEPSTASGGLPTETGPSWVEHFVKGLASLGLLSFIKAMLALSPWQWWNLRSSGVVSSGRTTGRSRAASISWIVILIGVGSFLWAVWKGVRTWSRKTLEKAGERVMDVPLPDDDDEDEPFASAEKNQSSKKDD
ncbi:hypothetical protein LV164_003286 [Aspergillus fumigatus]|uniref:Uncharacterized protein n=1 Tax=Aspergillus fumigatus TaxID=746128 RepID=A0A229YA36_ASPFM|nr:hypothetical protein CNMCM8714_006089 [Aspergillus fumigatus]KMK56188.1 RING finger domain-containing protein [Aspergillus fumigatus Z5]KAF4274051.1 hypothetical protein CNMCM8812_006270 [Aspergillus fumigatus]KAF4295410.1 hypothetical protein CNMCM8686_008506 [Aspergillus fumigatus]KAH1305146.1 hypothetical protein KXX11_000139 [Aspergillus fumigatus]